MRNFLLVVADVQHEVVFLETVQDNVAADEQEHIFELVYFDSVIFGSVRSGFFMTVHSVAASNNVVKERDSCTPGQPSLRARFDTNLSATQDCFSFDPRHGDTIKSRSGGGVLVLGASMAVLIAFCEHSSCISRRLWRDSILMPSNHL